MVILTAEESGQASSYYLGVYVIDVVSSMVVCFMFLGYPSY